MTRIVLLGYGQMGKQLEALAPSMKCEVVGVFDVGDSLQAVSEFDVAIDFTQPTAVIDNARAVCALGKDLVIGTTGWLERMSEVNSMQIGANNGIVWGSNFSVGVQIFFRLVRSAGMLIDDVPEFDVSMHEWHHTRKKDAPSGTAISAAQILQDEIQRAVPIGSTREGDIVGIHSLTLEGPTDTIEIKHSAKDRTGFAKGALLAARWIHGRKGVFDFTDAFPRIVAEMQQ